VHQIIIVSVKPVFPKSAQYCLELCCLT